jgi:hypothetical protein
MSYDNMREGQFDAQIQDWGLQEVEKVRQLQAFINFEFEVDGQTQKMRWSSFLFKKDGTVNKHTMETLRVCGFKSSKITDLVNTSALNNKKTYHITTEKEGEYWRVKWVNDPDESPMSKAADAKVLAGYDLSKFNAALMKDQVSAPPVKNYAPGASNPPALDTEEKLPF